MSSTTKGYIFLVMPIVLIGFILLCSSYMKCEKEAGNSMQSGKHELTGEEEEVEEYDPEDPERNIRMHSFGPSTGVVLDAETRKPISGAQIMAHASYAGGIGIELIESDKFEFTQTDENGKYYVPKISYDGIFLEVANFYLVVYKAGYVAYNTGKPFHGAYENTKFKIKGNVVLLEKWDDKKFTKRDRVDHVEIIRCDSITGVGDDKKKAMRYVEYCREAREEMILACMAHDSDRGRDLCIEIVDDKLGLSKRREEKR